MRQDNLYVEVGKAVELIQLTDRVFKSVLLLVFPGKEINDLNTFKRNKKLLDKATLGRLMSLLKERVSLSDNFGTTLESYLEDRNSLIHNWDEIEGWKDEDNAIKFTVDVQKKAAYLTCTFIGFMRSWMEQAEISGVDEQFPDERSFFEYIDSDWKHLIHEYVENIESGH